MKKKGLIVIGYPGVGKSSIGGKENCVDLESGCFWTGDRRVSDWYLSYCQMAMSIANQGYTVLISSHGLVLEYMESAPKLDNIGQIMIFCPKKEMKEEWVKRLEARYNKTKLYKDYRALYRAINNYNHDIAALCEVPLPLIQPNSVDYDLMDYIHYAQNLWCKET